MSGASEPTASARRRHPLLFRIIRARARLFVSLFAGVLTGLVLPDDWEDVTRALLGWNAGVIAYLVLSAELMARATRESMMRRSQFEDEGRVLILVLSILTACASMGAIVLELGSAKNLAGGLKAAHLGLAIVTVVASWTFIHLMFTFHYAHEYYFERATSPDRKPELRGGLIFPGTDQPNYVDFLYFAYVIGVACQTADVSTSSPTMRAVALAQGMLAFFYNTTILALMVNIASGIL